MLNFTCQFVRQEPPYPVGGKQGLRRPLEAPPSPERPTLHTGSSQGPSGEGAWDFRALLPGRQEEPSFAHTPALSKRLFLWE